jgi:hypothetical protein
MVYLEQGFKLTLEMLNSTACPLPEEERTAALRRARQRHTRRLLSPGLRRGRVAEAWRMFKSWGLGPAGFLQVFRRYQTL